MSSLRWGRKAVVRRTDVLVLLNGRNERSFRPQVFEGDEGIGTQQFDILRLSQMQGGGDETEAFGSFQEPHTEGS